MDSPVPNGCQDNHNSRGQPPLRHDHSPSVSVWFSDPQQQQPQHRGTVSPSLSPPPAATTEAAQQHATNMPSPAAGPLLHPTATIDGRMIDAEGPYAAGGAPAAAAALPPHSHRASVGQVKPRGRARSRSVSVGAAAAMGAAAGGDGGAAWEASVHVRRKHDRDAVDITIDLLRAKSDGFSKDVNETAKALGVCCTALKKKCRDLGLDSWPFRVWKRCNYLREKYLEEAEGFLAQATALEATQPRSPLGDAGGTEAAAAGLGRDAIALLKDPRVADLRREADTRMDRIQQVEAWWAGVVADPRGRDLQAEPFFVSYVVPWTRVKYKEVYRDRERARGGSASRKTRGSRRGAATASAAVAVGAAATAAAAAVGQEVEGWAGGYVSDGTECEEDRDTEMEGQATGDGIEEQEEERMRDLEEGEYADGLGEEEVQQEGQARSPLAVAGSGRASEPRCFSFGSGGGTSTGHRHGPRLAQQQQQQHDSGPLPLPPLPHNWQQNDPWVTGGETDGAPGAYQLAAATRQQQQQATLPPQQRRRLSQQQRQPVGERGAKRPRLDAGQQGINVSGNGRETCLPPGMADSRVRATSALGHLHPPAQTHAGPQDSPPACALTTGASVTSAAGAPPGAGLRIKLSASAFAAAAAVAASGGGKPGAAAQTTAPPRTTNQGVPAYLKATHRAGDQFLKPQAPAGSAGPSLKLEALAAAAADAAAEAAAAERSMHDVYGSTSAGSSRHGRGSGSRGGDSAGERPSTPPQMHVRPLSPAAAVTAAVVSSPLRPQPQSSCNTAPSAARRSASPPAAEPSSSPTSSGSPERESSPQVQQPTAAPPMAVPAPQQCAIADGDDAAVTALAAVRDDVLSSAGSEAAAAARATGPVTTGSAGDALNVVFPRPARQPLPPPPPPPSRPREEARQGRDAARTTGEDEPQGLRQRGCGLGLQDTHQLRLLQALQKEGAMDLVNHVLNGGCIGNQRGEAADTVVTATLAANAGTDARSAGAARKQPLRPGPRAGGPIRPGPRAAASARCPLPPFAQQPGMPSTAPPALPASQQQQPQQQAMSASPSHEQLQQQRQRPAVVTQDSAAAAARAVRDTLLRQCRDPAALTAAALAMIAAASAASAAAPPSPPYSSRPPSSPPPPPGTTVTAATGTGPAQGPTAACAPGAVGPTPLPPLPPPPPPAAAAVGAPSQVMLPSQSPRASAHPAPIVHTAQPDPAQLPPPPPPGAAAAAASPGSLQDPNAVSSVAATSTTSCGAGPLQPSPLPLPQFPLPPPPPQHQHQPVQQAQQHLQHHPQQHHPPQHHPQQHHPQQHHPQQHQNQQHHPQQHHPQQHQHQQHHPQQHHPQQHQHQQHQHHLAAHYQQHESSLKAQLKKAQQQLKAKDEQLKEAHHRIQMLEAEQKIKDLQLQLAQQAAQTTELKRQMAGQRATDAAVAIQQPVMGGVPPVAATAAAVTSLAVAPQVAAVAVAPAVGPGPV